MLTTPVVGWTCLKLIDEKGKECKYPASYLTSVHNDCIDAFIRYYETWKPQCVEFDAEGWDFILVIEDYYCYVITRKDEVKIDTFEIKADDLCDELIFNIETDIDKWSCFDYDIESDREKKKEKQKILHKISHLKRMKKLYLKAKYGKRG